MYSNTLDRAVRGVPGDAPWVLRGTAEEGLQVGLHTLDPLSDKRWDAFVAEHPKASIFHRSGWLRALADTYGYEPLVLTTAAAGEPLREAIPFCRVASRITGTRLVSVPFADHCEPLTSADGSSAEFMQWFAAECGAQRFKYVELRPLADGASAQIPFGASSSYWFHTLDLTPSNEDIFRRLDKDSLQRRIRRAEREPLEYDVGHTEHLIKDFYHLLLKTRRRHQWIPQPQAWFRQLARNLGENLEIRVARKNGTPIAALLTLRFRDTVVYKYGCSDEKAHHLAGIPFLFWKLIEESKSAGANLLDFGRTDLGHDSLIRFKDQFGTTRRQITYFRYPTQVAHQANGAPWNGLRTVLSMMPDALLSKVGQLAYRHLG